MKKISTLMMCLLAGWVAGTRAQSNLKLMKVDKALTAEAKTCLECHAEKTPLIVNDWKESRHSHVGVTCIDCHSREADAPDAAQNCPGVKGTDIYLSPLVSPKTCARCHEQEVREFEESGHLRARKQIESKGGMQKLMSFHEGQNHPEFQGGPDETGCMQCHGSIIKLDANKRPTAETWPNAGMGTVYPDGGIGNCATCHTRHRFNIAEARKPAACASCHLGPDHPDIEIYISSKHGHIFEAEGDEWTYDSPPDAWEPGDYRAPTCATCHMSGIGALKTTHNVSSRLYWNAWGKSSQPRNSEDPMNPLTGDAEAGRAMMKQVCSNCHSKLHTDGFFAQADKHVKLYNESYYAPAKKMLDQLQEKGLLDDNPWDDEFQKIFYHLWHHEGRRMRQGALMGSADYAHWHGSFECMQDLYKLKKIYKERTGEAFE